LVDEGVEGWVGGVVEEVGVVGAVDAREAAAEDVGVFGFEAVGEPEWEIVVEGDAVEVGEVDELGVGEGGEEGADGAEDPLIGLALALVVVAGFALYARMLLGPWRGIYAVTAMLSFYLLLFVLVAQAFQKVPALRALAPAGSVPPFALVEGVLLAVFVGLTWLAARRFTTYRPVS
jgi:hypothetical protein